jgi:putative transposase
MPTFFLEEDYATYVGLMKEWCEKWSVDVLAWCLMPNHVHLILVPKLEEGLARAVGEAHRRYTRAVNFREKWRGHLWQGRFSSCVMDEPHTWMAIRYVELNPVRAGMVQEAKEYRWSSARGHEARTDDALVTAGATWTESVKDWAAFLAQGTTEEQLSVMRRHERTGRPMGGESFLTVLERKLKRRLQPEKRGPRGPWKHKE